MEELNYPWSGCCGVAVAAVAVNHSGIQLANESALEGFSQQTVGCDTEAHTEVCPGQDDSILLLCFDVPQKHKRYNEAQGTRLLLKFSSLEIKERQSRAC